MADNAKKSVFLKVVCSRCGNSQFVFGKSSTWAKCRGCNKLLVRPTGGKTKIKTFVKEVLKWSLGKEI
ncbi:MAG: 30S ribosomal protein S27e [Nanoarchaeota archaeon]